MQASQPPATTGLWSLLFLGSSLIAVTATVWIFIVGKFSMRSSPMSAVVLTEAVATTLLLTGTLHVVASRRKQYLYSSTVRLNDRSLALQDSGLYALWLVQSVFLGFFLFFALYVTPSLELQPLVSLSGNFVTLLIFYSQSINTVLIILLLLRYLKCLQLPQLFCCS